MLRLPSVFSSGALFQQRSALTLRGVSDGDSVTVRLLYGGAPIDEASAAVTDGRFSLTLTTPAASLDEYTLRVDNGTDEIVLEHILFGELWLASGQSNMEFQNLSMPGCTEYLAALRDKPLRVFLQDYPVGRGKAEFPRTPSDALGGKWITPDGTDLMRCVSALGTAFLAELTHYFRDRIPVGFLNASWGDTPINGWLPEDALRADPALAEKAEKLGVFAHADAWNSYGEGNFQQPFAMYNSKIAPLLGVRVRGVLWYQGENDCGGEFAARIYRQYLTCYHRVYSERFAADPLNFMMISSLLYPWAYGEDGDTSLGYLNQAFIDTATAQPHKFAFMPIADLPPVWSYHTKNHAIHPANKYDVGYRMALLAETNSYDRGSQRTPATLDSWEVSGSRLLLRFKHASSGLTIRGGHIRGLYVAGADRVYMAAECEIVAPDTLAVWHPYLREPKNAAYGYASFEEELNLFAGEFPVASFATDQENRIVIEGKPWLDLARPSVWAILPRDSALDVFYHPVWQPLGASEICPDNAFTQSGLSLRICSDAATFGASVKSYKYNRLDLYHYAALRVKLFNTDQLNAKLVLDCAGQAEPLELPLVQKETAGYGWHWYEASFAALTACDIRRMSFVFTQKSSPLHFVNLESPVLIPRA